MALRLCNGYSYVCGETRSRKTWEAGTGDGWRLVSGDWGLGLGNRGADAAAVLTRRWPTRYDYSVTVFVRHPSL